MTDSKGNILVTGASGMIGSAVCRHFGKAGYAVYPLSRKDPKAPFYYDQEADEMHLDPDIPLHTVINLAGANLADGRWTESRKQLILESRTRTTTLLCAALSKRSVLPRQLLSASAMGYYGDTGDQIADEDSPPGSGFLARVSREWEQATMTAREAGIRTVLLRFGLVLSPQGGLLEKFQLPFRLGAVGRVGDGQHYMCWISLDDVLATMEQAIANDQFSGPVNVVSNHEVSNDEFTRQVATAMGRPRMPPLPAFIVKLVFGQMGEEALLASNRVRSRRMQELGVQLKDPELLPALNRMLNDD